MHGPTANTAFAATDSVDPRHLLLRAEAEGERLGAIFAEAERCADLWIAVVELAVRDLTWLGRAQRGNGSRRYRLSEFTHGDVVMFFRSGAFADVCGLLGTPEDIVRRHYGIDALLSRARRNSDRREPNERHHDAHAAHRAAHARA